MNISHQSVRPATLSVKQDMTVKLSDPTLFNNVSSFASVVQDYTGSMKGHYLSPILVKERKFPIHLRIFRLLRWGPIALSIILTRVTYFP